LVLANESWHAISHSRKNTQFGVYPVFMILHIAPDDKFVPFLQGLFEEALPGENMWRVLTCKPIPAFAVPAGDMEIVGNEYYGSEKFKNDLQIADCVIFHSMNLSSRQKLLVLSRIPVETTIIWRGWGFDYYGILQANGLRLLLPETSSLIKRPSILERFSVKQLPRKLLNAIFLKTAAPVIANKLIVRIDYFSCCIPGDYDALKLALPNFKAQFLPLNYYSVEDIFLKGDGLQDLAGEDILLGNSATPANNHIEVMRALGKLGLQGRKVIVPLSYGDMKYRERIIQAGKDLLGESFIPLTDYMSLPEYNRFISSCGILIMNHIRQQAMGNISSALLRGGKVFLRQENPICNYYTRMGVKLFPFSDDITIEDLDAPLNKEDVLRNKEIMLSIWSRAQGIKNVKSISLLGK
jgi:dTDP-N-acetylfucosamine:lipid II N-acetylfucosaminyltransferase